MSIHRRVLLMAPLAAPALAQSWPAGQQVSLVIPYSAGGASDVVGRIIQGGLQKLGGTIILEHRPGATTTLAARHVKAARPDGNTLFMGTIATFALAPNSFRNPGYDPLADFTHLTEVVESISVLVAHPRWQSLAQLLEAARARPGQLSYASWGVGSTAHLPMLELLGRANADMLHVPYNGAPPALTDTIAGRTDAMIVLLAAGRAQIEAGRVRPLGMVSGARTDSLPGVPTIAEQGFEGFRHSGWFSLQAPPGLPEALAERIRAAMREQLADPEVQRICAQNGLAPTLPERQGEAPVRARITLELVQFRELMARAGLQPE
jgi:tripartite-type tricarboxylate transporter receptor subunit TctC